MVKAASIAGLLAHFFSPGALADWVPLTVPPIVRFLSSAAAVVVIAAIAAVLLMSGPPSHAAAQWGEFRAVLVVILLVSPVTWTQLRCVLSHTPDALC